ncbi:MAG TPA: hypothetical protein VE008_03245 [Burkholderiales bacterium]|nr:hypothetical protein [Burkholderiales bacterium]
MAQKFVFGNVQGLYASPSDIFVNMKGKWYFANTPIATGILTVASDARRAGNPVLLSYEDSNDHIYFIECL